MFYRQWTLYTCGTTVFRAVVREFNGKHISENEAVELVGTTRKGTNFKQIEKALKDFNIGIDYFKEVTKTNIDAALDLGRWVAVADHDTWSYDHIFLVTGKWMGMYVVVDSLIGFPIMYTKNYVVKTARNAGFSIFKKVK